MKWGQVVDDDMFDEHFIPFRYQGQYHDEEADLYYNRFRYYDPQLGQYITQDPIGLEGENPTLYGYVHDPNMWIDPFGLRCKRTTHTSNSRSGAFNQAKRDANVPRSQQPHRVTRDPLLDQNNNRIIRNGRIVETRNYHFTSNNGRPVIIQEHSWGHVKGNQPPHFNVRPPSNPNTGHIPGTHGHYRFPGIIRE